MTRPKRLGWFSACEHWAEWFFERVGRACGWILVVMAFMITIDIVLRELRTAGFINFNWHFVSEWSAFLVIFIVFAGLAYTLSSGGHIIVSLLVDRIPHRGRSAIALLMALASELVLVYMLYRGFLWMMMSINRGITSTTVMKTPLWIPNLFVVFGLALFVIAVLLFIIRQAINVVGPTPPPGDEEPDANGGAA